MGVVFNRGQILGRGDLDIFLSNDAGNPQNAASITFALYWVDPNSGAEVLVGDAARAPVNPAVGEYYAAIMVPASAAPGNYRIRWTFRQRSNYPDEGVVQEWGVVGDGVDTGSGGGGTDGSLTHHVSSCEADLIRKLRFLLRDNCIGAEETVEVDADGIRMVIRMDELFEALGDVSPLPLEICDAP